MFDGCYAGAHRTHDTPRAVRMCCHAQALSSGLLHDNSHFIV